MSFALLLFGHVFGSHHLSFQYHLGSGRLWHVNEVNIGKGRLGKVGTVKVKVRIR